MSQKIQIVTEDKLHLDGIYSEGSKEKPAVLFIHGMFNNFQKPDFVKTLEKELLQNDFAFLATNSRGAGEGSRYELLEEAHLDITAGINFLLAKGHSQIILIGHSAGTIKAVRYLFGGEFKAKIVKLVLVVPVDFLAGRIAHGRVNLEDFLKKAQEQVDEGKGTELITPEFDHDVLSYQTFISWYKRDDFGRMFEFCDKNYDFPILRKLKIPTKIIVGSKDTFFHPSNLSHPEEAMNIILKNIPNSEGKIIKGAEHSFDGFEKQLTEDIINFI